MPAKDSTAKIKDTVQNPLEDSITLITKIKDTIQNSVEDSITTIIRIKDTIILNESSNHECILWKLVPVFTVLLAFALAKGFTVWSKYRYYVNMQHNLRIYLNELYDLLKKSIEGNKNMEKYYNSLINNKESESEPIHVEYEYGIDRIMSINQAELYTMFIYMRQISNQNRDISHKAYNDVFNNLALLKTTQNRFNDLIGKYSSINGSRNKILELVGNYKQEIVENILSDSSSFEKKVKDNLYAVVMNYEKTVKAPKNYSEHVIIEFIGNVKGELIEQIKLNPKSKEEAFKLYRMANKIEHDVTTLIKDYMGIEALFKSYTATMIDVESALKKDFKLIDDIPNNNFWSMFFKLA